MNVTFSDIGTIVSLCMSLGSFIYYYAVLSTKVEYLTEVVRKHEEKWENNQALIIQMTQIKSSLEVLSNAVLRLEKKLEKVADHSHA